MKTLILLSIMQLGAAGSDAYFTNRNMQSGPRAFETNPIARQFVGTPKGCAVYFSATAALHIGGAILLRKRHHEKLAVMLLGEGVADNGGNAVWSATH